MTPLSRHPRSCCRSVTFGTLVAATFVLLACGPDGGFVVRFTAPAGVGSHAYDHPFVYGTVRDELDVLYVVRWRIVDSR